MELATSNRSTSRCRTGHQTMNTSQFRRCGEDTERPITPSSLTSSATASITRSEPTVLMPKISNESEELARKQSVALTLRPATMRGDTRGTAAGLEGAVDGLTGLRFVETDR